MANRTEVRCSKTKSQNHLLQRRKQLFKLAKKLEECHGVSIMIFTCIPQEKLIENVGYGPIGKELLYSGKGKEICRAWENCCHEAYRISQQNDSSLESLPKKICYSHKEKLGMNLGMNKNLQQDVMSQIEKLPMFSETSVEVHPRTPVSIEVEACKTLGKRFQDLCTELSSGNLSKRIRLESPSPAPSALINVQQLNELPGLCKYSSPAPLSLRSEAISISIEESVPLILEWNLEFPVCIEEELHSTNIPQHQQKNLTCGSDTSSSGFLHTSPEVEETNNSYPKPDVVRSAKSVDSKQSGNTFIHNIGRFPSKYCKKNEAPKKRETGFSKKRIVKKNSRKTNELNIGMHTGTRDSSLSATSSEDIDVSSTFQFSVDPAITAVNATRNTNPASLKCELSVPTTSCSTSSGNSLLYNELIKPYPASSERSRIKKIKPKRTASEAWNTRTEHGSTKQQPPVGTEVCSKSVTYATSCSSSLIFQNPTSFFLSAPTIVESSIYRDPTKSTNRSMPRAPSFPWFPNPFRMNSRSQQLNFPLPWPQFSTVASARPNRPPPLLPIIEEINNSNCFFTGKRSSSDVQPFERGQRYDNFSGDQRSLPLPSLMEIGTPFCHFSLQTGSVLHNTTAPRIDPISALDLSVEPLTLQNFQALAP